MKKLSMSDFGIFMLAFKILLISLAPQLSGEFLNLILEQQIVTLF